MGASSSQMIAVVIDDDAAERSSVIEVLARAGLAVHSVSPATAVESVRRYSPVVTVLGIDIPDADGFEIARRIRADSATYLVVLSTRSAQSDVILGYQSGADCYMTKPLRPLELRARVEAMLRRARRS
ncbi:response regulator [Microbacterium profundi]|uniref:response regulator transcription factor n=1 Tax=Microbacterium profundi TaxID=450380 RepID=UPI001F315E0D|nr:response regulator [Microbacterium profundi]MCE7481229.1 response regulator [Microbacterium profundi]